jgi:hypothetical protein
MLKSASVNMAGPEIVPPGRARLAELEAHTRLQLADGFDIDRASSGVDMRKVFVDQRRDLVNRKRCCSP